MAERVEEHHDDHCHAVSVIIATRDRPDALRHAVASILESDHDSFEIVVVDQSDRPTSLGPDPRVVHLPTSTRGKSLALAVATDVARGELLAFTDDDCTVTPDWLAIADALFREHPEIDVAFGSLVAIDHDPVTTFVPCSEIEEFRVLRGTESIQIRGLAGADLVLRRPVLDVVGVFDPELGPGAHFPACEDVDIYWRSLLAGFAVARAPQLRVLHWGSRPYSDGSAYELVRGYEYCEGAVIAKHLLLEPGRFVHPTIEILGWGAWHAVPRCCGARSAGRCSSCTSCRGVAGGLLWGVDRRRRRLRAPSSDAHPKPWGFSRGTASW